MTNPRSDYIHLATLRLDWASAGIDRLEELVNSFLATKPCEVVSRMHREGQNARINYVLRVHEQPPPTVSFATGDVIHNLRATLDNLVWGVGRIFKARDRLGLEFHDSEDTFRDCYLPQISVLPQPIQDWVTSIQPHLRGYRPVFFYTLHNLWNRDKHRTPTVVNSAIGTTNLGYSGDRTPLRQITFNNVSRQNDQEHIATALVPWEQRYDFKPEFSLLVAFDAQGPVGLNMVGMPEEVVDY